MRFKMMMVATIIKPWMTHRPDREAFSPTDKDKKPVVRIYFWIYTYSSSVCPLVLHSYLLVLLAYLKRWNNQRWTYFQPQLIEDAGFSAEEHTVVTEDGYLLTIHRFLLFTLAHLWLNQQRHQTRFHMSPITQNCWSWKWTKASGFPPGIKEKSVFFLNLKAATSSSDLHLSNKI